VKIQLPAFPEFLNAASKTTIEAGNSVVVFVKADLGSATRAASTKPNHEGCPWELHPLTVDRMTANSSAIPCRCSDKSLMDEITFAPSFFTYLARHRLRSIPFFIL
jgi:hypothetical protein